MGNTPATYDGMQRADPTARLARQEQVLRIVAEIEGGLKPLRHWHPAIRESLESLKLLRRLLAPPGDGV